MPPGLSMPFHAKSYFYCQSVSGTVEVVIGTCGITRETQTEGKLKLQYLMHYIHSVLICFVQRLV